MNFSTLVTLAFSAFPLLSIGVSQTSSPAETVVAKGENDTVYEISEAKIPVTGKNQVIVFGDFQYPAKMATQYGTITWSDKENIVQKLNFDEHLIIENSVPFQIEEADLHRSMTLSGYFVNSEEKVNLTVSKQATIIESDGTEIVVAPIERQFNSASLWNRIKTNAAGPMNNFILSIIIFIIVGFMQGGVPSNDPVIGQVSDQSAAHEAGLQTSDKIISIDGVDIHSWDEMTSIVRSSADKTLSMSIQRNGDTKNVSITPKSVEGQNGSKIGQLGVTRTLDNSILSILGYGFTQTISVIVLVLSALGSIFTKGFNLNQLGGPVAIYSLTSQVAKNGLIDLLKGKLPLKRMLSLMMLGQLLAVLVVSSSAASLLPYYHEMREMDRASDKWRQSTDRYRLSFGLAGTLTDEEGSRKANRAWQEFIQNRLDQTNSFYITSNVDNFPNGADMDTDGNRLNDYTPAGNVIYVSPRYLTEEKVAVSPDFLEKVQNLAEGEFGLILPENLREQGQYYQDLFATYLQELSSVSFEDTSQKTYIPKITMDFTKTGQERFLYNDGYKTSRQYLTDPIIVVLTPQATGTGPVAGMLWGSTANSGLKLDSYQESITALKEQGIYSWVSYLVKSQLSFAKVLNDKRVAFYSLLIGTILTLSTAILLFDSMNLLYFEQFRREIMIKRLSGMTIHELHGKYLLGQVGVLLLGLILSSILTGDGLISALVVALFALNALLILVRQDKKEEAGSMAVLKGK